MNNDDLKRYSVIVGEGSGCLFQPMTRDYTYVLTAKHLFSKEEEDDRGQTCRKEYPDNTAISIVKNIQTSTGWIEQQLTFVLQKDITYFPHKDADVAILKIPYQDENFEQIVTSDILPTTRDFELCGFPNTMRGNIVGEKYTSHKIERLITSGNYSHSAQLFGTLNQATIEGMSGCGVLKLNGNYISILGIQSKMATTQFPVGQIGFVPVKYLNEIVDYQEYNGKLEKLYPSYLKCFSFLKSDAFNLDAGFWNNDIEFTKNYLKSKADEVITSPLTPVGIKSLFEKRLLLGKEEGEVLQTRFIWLAWLEFLIILNLIKKAEFSENSIKDIFNNVRLLCSDTDEDWSAELNNIIYSDYKGLRKNGTVVLGFKTPPINDTYVLDRNIPMISQAIKAHDRDLLQIDDGIKFPLTEYKFIHIEYFKKQAIAKKHAEYAQITDDDLLLEKLKIEYKILLENE